MKSKGNDKLAIDSIARIFLDLKQDTRMHFFDIYDKIISNRANIDINAIKKNNLLTDQEKILLEQLSQALATPDAANTNDVINVCKLLADALYSDDYYATSILFKKIDLFHDDGVAHDILYKLLDKDRTENRHNIALHLINLPNATTKDYARALSYIRGDSELLQKILNDAFQKLDQEIITELDKILPDDDKIYELLRNANDFIRELCTATNQPHPELREKYDYKNIMANPTPKYIQKYNDSALTQIQEQKAQIAQKDTEIAQKDAEIARLQSTITTLRSQIDALGTKMNDQHTHATQRIAQKDTEITELHQQISAVNVELNNARRESNQRKAKIMELSSAIMQIKGGLGARGIKEAQAIAQQDHNAI